jgi:hypothetical protein
MAKQKADMANKEKEAAILKVNSLQKEVRPIGIRICLINITRNQGFFQ